MNGLELVNLKQRRLYIWGEITDIIAKEFVTGIHYLISHSHAPIYVIINSPGGSLSAEECISGEMVAAQNLGIIVNTIVIGEAYSAAASILAMGTPGYRYSRPSGTVMLHPCSYSLDQDYAENQEKLNVFMKKQIDMFNRRLFKICKKNRSFKKFLRDIDKGLWLNAKDALEYGVIDHITEELIWK